ncbi:hypothetical protein [Nocardia abscessus]|uniref:hypothetical protein n=1 Tax=Nocardia abscessus TaxID=120957 RepID=UPI002456CC86|nr:hypothetical protein [Nocardia abscessus]
MTFDVASYDSVVRELERFLKTIDSSIKVDVPHAESAALDLPYVRLIPPVQRAVKVCADKIVEVCRWIWEKIYEIIQGIRAPYEMYLRSNEWATVRNAVTSIQGEIDPNNLQANRNWKGAAQLSYLKTNTSQSAAAGKMGDVSDKARSAMMECAVGGLAFYSGILVICGSFLLGLARAIGELASGVGAPISIADIAATSGLSAAQLWAAVAAVTSFIGLQAKAFSELNSALSDNSTFPGGWPDSQASTFADASVEGDGESKWRLS